MAEEGYVVANGNYELIDGGLYVVVNGSYQAVSEAYVVKNGVYERFYTAERLKGISENLSFSESIEVTVLKSFSDSLSLSESMGKFEEDRDHIKGLSETLSFSDTVDIVTLKTFSDELTISNGAEDLSTSWNSSSCGVDLSWNAYELDQQEIWRCSGSSCSPTSGTKVDTVAAGTSSYFDQFEDLSADDTDDPSLPNEDSGDYTYKVVPVTNASGTNNSTVTSGTC